MGEPGMVEKISTSTRSLITSSKVTSASKKRKNSEKSAIDINDVMSTMMKCCNTNNIDQVAASSKAASTVKEQSLNNLSLDDLNKMIDQHKRHL